MEQRTAGIRCSSDCWSPRAEQPDMTGISALVPEEFASLIKLRTPLSKSRWRVRPNRKVAERAGQRDAIGTVVLASTMTPVAAGGAAPVNLHDVTLTPASGWTIADQDQDSVILTNSDHSAEFSVVVIPNAGLTDVNQAASLAISGFVKGAGLTNVQQQQEGPVQTIQSNNFQQGLVTDYTGNIQTNQGTVELYGNWITMLNPSTQMVCFVDVDAPSSQALQAATPDAESMVGSML
jgi:hypothetical protein